MMQPQLRQFLDSHKTYYHVHTHEPGYTASQMAHQVHVPGRQFAKSVLLHVLDDPPGKMLLAVVPADREVDLELVRARLGCDVELANEEAIVSVFPQCELGCIPPLAEMAATELPVVVDDRLSAAPGIAFAAGTTTDVVEMPWSEYERISRHTVAHVGRLPAVRQPIDW